MNTLRIGQGQRVDFYPDGEEPYGPPPLPPARPTAAATRAAAYSRLEAYVSSASMVWRCDDLGDPEHDFDGCGSAPIPNSGLFVHDSGDAQAIDRGDIAQGSMGDCYLLATLDAMASSADGRTAIQNAIHENKDEGGHLVSYTVTLHEVGKRWWLWGATTSRSVEVALDPSFVPGHALVRRSGQPREVWPLVIERAYAQLRGGHNAIAHGGQPSAVMQALTGRPATRTELSDGYGPTDLERDVSEGKIVVLGTKHEEPLGYGLTAAHCYAVVGIEPYDGASFVRLADPWGVAAEPVPLDEIGRWFHAVDVGSAR